MLEVLLRLGLILLAAVVNPACCLFPPTQGWGDWEVPADQYDAQIPQQLHGSLLVLDTWDQSAQLISFPDGSAAEFDLPWTHVASISGPNDAGHVAVFSSKRGTILPYSGYTIEIAGDASGEDRRELFASRTQIDRHATIAIAPNDDRCVIVYREDHGESRFSGPYLDLVAAAPDPALPPIVTRVSELAKLERPVWVLGGAGFVYLNDDPDVEVRTENAAPRRTPVSHLSSVLYYDVAREDRTFLAHADMIAPSARDTSILLVRGDEVTEFDVVTGSSGRTAILPGLRSQQVIGQDPVGHVLYQADATTSEPVVNPAITFATGSHTWTIKVCDPSSGRFGTLVHRVSHVDADYRPTSIDAGDAR